MDGGVFGLWFGSGAQEIADARSGLIDVIDTPDSRISRTGTRTVAGAHDFIDISPIRGSILKRPGLGCAGHEMW
jgi:hypothetical protein